MHNICMFCFLKNVADFLLLTKYNIPQNTLNLFFAEPNFFSYKKNHGTGCVIVMA